MLQVFHGYNYQWIYLYGWIQPEKNMSLSILEWYFTLQSKW